jgi:hypothetical protein
LFTAWHDAQLAVNKACPSCAKEFAENKKQDIEKDKY